MPGVRGAAAPPPSRGLREGARHNLGRAAARSPRCGSRWCGKLQQSETLTSRTGPGFHLLQTQLLLRDGDQAWEVSWQMMMPPGTGYACPVLLGPKVCWPEENKKDILKEQRRDVFFAPSSRLRYANQEIRAVVEPAEGTITWHRSGGGEGHPQRHVFTADCLPLRVATSASGLASDCRVEVRVEEVRRNEGAVPSARADPRAGLSLPPPQREPGRVGDGAGAFSDDDSFSNDAGSTPGVTPPGDSASSRSGSDVGSGAPAPRDAAAGCLAAPLPPPAPPPAPAAGAAPPFSEAAMAAAPLRRWLDASPAFAAHVDAQPFAPALRADWAAGHTEKVQQWLEHEGVVERFFAGGAPPAAPLVSPPPPPPRPPPPPPRRAVAAGGSAGEETVRRAAEAQRAEAERRKEIEVERRKAELRAEIAQLRAVAAKEELRQREAQQLQQQQQRRPTHNPLAADAEYARRLQEEEDRRAEERRKSIASDGELARRMQEEGGKAEEDAVHLYYSGTEGAHEDMQEKVDEGERRRYSDTKDHYGDIQQEEGAGPDRSKSWVFRWLGVEETVQHRRDGTVAPRGYDQTQARMRSKCTGSGAEKRVGKYHVGEWRCESLGELRAHGKELLCAGRAPRGQPGLRNVRGDVGALHSKPFPGWAVFQVASQFNGLEFATPFATPEYGIRIYEEDKTQGPVCAMSCAAATAYRNYLVPVPGAGEGQREHSQLNCAEDFQSFLRLWSRELPFDVKNGYTDSDPRRLRELNANLRGMDDASKDDARSRIRVGVHYGADVTREDARPAGRRVTQVFASALSVGYSYGVPAPDRRELWGPVARLLLEAEYEATLWAAVINHARCGCAPGAAPPPVFLTQLGGGVFGNDPVWITDAISRALNTLRRAGAEMDVRVVHYNGDVGQRYADLAEQYPAAAEVPPLPIKQATAATAAPVAGIRPPKQATAATAAPVAGNPLPKQATAATAAPVAGSPHPKKQRAAAAAAAQAPGIPPSEEKQNACIIRKEPSERVGVTWERSLLVTEVDSGSAAERAGMRDFIGWRLTHVNGALVRNVLDAEHAMQGAKELTELTLCFEAVQAAAAAAAPAAKNPSSDEGRAAAAPAAAARLRGSVWQAPCAGTTADHYRPRRAAPAGRPGETQAPRTEPPKPKGRTNCDTECAIA